MIGFVTNGSFIDGNTDNGLRACLAEEFTGVYVFNLRGKQRTSGELSRQEGGKIFGSGSRAPIAITLLVKNPGKKGRAALHYHDIGDYLRREEKLKIIADFASIAGIATSKKWATLHPNAEHDWINQRDPAFENFIEMFRAPDENHQLFSNCSNGVQTNRDPWCYNYSAHGLENSVERLINFYEEQRRGFAATGPAGPSADRMKNAQEYVDNDGRKISWSRGLLKTLVRDQKLAVDRGDIRQAVYRPFCTQWLYLNRALNEYVFRTHKLYPSKDAGNVAIGVKQRWSGEGQVALMVGHVGDQQTDGGWQYFPMFLYESADELGKLEFGKSDGEVIDGYRRRDAITDAILKTFREAYGKGVSKEDVFYYVYGVLHSPEYRTRFAADLKKMLPRIPLTQETKDFKAFSKAGRDLAHWHLNYETVEPWAVVERMDQLSYDPWEDFKVKKMTFDRPTPDQKKAGLKWDKTKIIYNSHVTISHIPLEAYEYVVNGKPALEWIIERYQVTRDKASGIVNDPNDWCREHDQPRYIIDLIARVVRVSIETMKIVKALPALNERR